MERKAGTEHGGEGVRKEGSEEIKRRKETKLGEENKKLRERKELK